MKITSSGCYVEIDTLNKLDYENIVRELTVEPIQKYQTNTKYRIYKKNKKWLIIPRYYAYNKCKDIPIEMSVGYDINVTFHGNLKKETNQIEAAKNTIESLKNKHGGILNLPTGYGKTTVALYVLSKLKKKTLIVVHKEFLMNQWIEKIKQFIPEAKIGKIQGEEIDIVDKDIVIGMLQSLSMKDYDKIIFETFGLTIIDEAHHICTRTFSQFLMKYSTKKILGLSATLNRSDGLTKVLHWFMGDITYTIKRSNQRHVTIMKKMYNCEMYKDNFPLNIKRDANIPEAINKITEIQKRNEMIIEEIERLYREGRKILLLSDRREHCKNLIEMLTKKGYVCGLYIGGVQMRELKATEKLNIIIGTYSLAHEGLDISDLDTLILSTPKSNIEQAVGRILRETDGKKNKPLVIDIIDKWGVFEKQYYKRQIYYKQTGFNIENEELEETQNNYLFVD